MAEHVWKGEAPGRLDVMGGVADYSGSLVLQTPISAMARVAIMKRPEPELQVSSTWASEVTLPLYWLRDLRDQPTSVWRNQLDERQVPRWALYPLGCFLLFCHVHDWWPTHGLNVEVESDVPMSMGVSSSAALEVATLRALEHLSGLEFTGTERARLAQRAENEVVGAPCGLMDQLASSHGVAGALLPILCRPDILGDPIPLPAGLLVVGWPSGVKHDVAASPYATARTAAFMGKKILEQAFSRSLSYLTELSPSQISRLPDESLPTTLTGEEFLTRFDGVDDPLSAIKRQQIYPVRAGANFPVEENFRCQLAAQLLQACGDMQRCSSEHVNTNMACANTKQEECLRSVGELMFQSHEGYSSMGLGCAQTDAMVEAVKELGPSKGFYGARVSGGGSGGTVVVLLEQLSLPQLHSMVDRISGTATVPCTLIG
jgi:L-arabinokinase